jgi:signal transduction histidine kinase
MTVKDSGEGISPEVLNYIFDPYFTTKDVGQGTGTDLSRNAMTP